MLRYILKRVVSAIITIWFIMTLTFFLMKAIPGDPFSTEKMADPVIIENIKAKYGLDRPLSEQYVKYLNDYIHGDFGISFMKKGLTTNDIIFSGFPYSLRIGVWASAIVLVVGVFFGIIAALRQNKFVDRLLMLLSTLGATIPSFVFATGFLFVFSKILGLVPSYGVNNWKGYIGPVIVSALFSLAYVVRLMRTSTLDVLNQDYIRHRPRQGPAGVEGARQACHEKRHPPGCHLHRPHVRGADHRFFRCGEGVRHPGNRQPVHQQYPKPRLHPDHGHHRILLRDPVICILVVDILYVLIDPRIKYQ